MKIKRYSGKIAGFLAGLFATGNFIGALLSAMLGHFLFDFKENIHDDFEAEIIDDHTPSYKANMLQSLLSITVYYIMQLKNRIVIGDINQIKEYFIEKFNFDMNDIVLIERNIASIMQKEDYSDLRCTAAAVNQYCHHREKAHIIELLFILASFGGKVADDASIKIIAGLLNIKKSEYLNIRGKYTDEGDYYKILELESGATPAQIKKAYRKLCIIHHPDKAGDKYNKEHFQKIVEAYMYLSQSSSTGS